MTVAPPDKSPKLSDQPAIDEEWHRMWWRIGAGANFVVALAYLGIAYAILRPLIASRQLRSNRLGAATAAIFLTCAVHHGGHTVHMLLPVIGVERDHGLALRSAFDWHQAAWDVLTAAIGIYYWTLRRTYGPLMRGATLFEDLKQRQAQALEINDEIVQGLTVAKLALETGHTDRSVMAMEATLVAAQEIISSLLGDEGEENRFGAGHLRRSGPARIRT
jgi:hypothetical protein